ncbi:MAG: hypothetical protein ACOCYU_06825 [Brevefilum sp.]
MLLKRRIASVSVLLALIFIMLTSCSLSGRAGDAPARTPEIPAESCLIDPEVELGSINPLVYGVNHGPWAVITEKTLPLAQEAKITMIRFPGGNWGDENNLQPYHIDQFVFLADQIGAEVSINVRLFGGSPELAADLVRYANIEKDYGIKYWGIGNEPTLFATSRGAPDYGVEQFNQEWRSFAETMKAVDESILLIGPELHQFGSSLGATPKDPFGLDWMTEFLKANGDMVDIVSIHRYPFPQTSGGRAANVEDLMGASEEWDEIIPYLRNLILETTGEDLPIAVTEVNSHWSNAIGGEATPDSFMNAIWWADVLGRMINNNVEIVNYFSLQSQPSIGGYGLFSRAEPRPTYYVYKLYQEFGDNLVFSGCDHQHLRIYAAQNESEELTVILINMNEESISTPLMLKDGGWTLKTVRRLDEQNLYHNLTLENFDDLEALSFPAYSITQLQFE